MAYHVSISTRAERDLDDLYDRIGGTGSEAARNWYRGLVDAMASLEHAPRRCPANGEDPRQRQLLYGRKPHIYRVIFRILEPQKEVVILHICHGAMARESWMLP